MRILLTGITGFAGGFLTEELLARPDVTIFGTTRRHDWAPPADWSRSRVQVYPCDLGDGRALDKLMQASQPEQIYHLAGFAHAGQSFAEPDAAWDGNLRVTRCLYDAVARWKGNPRILFVSSGLVYGESDAADGALDERSPLRPNSPYSASKAAADLVSFQYTCVPGLNIVRVRPFNHIGPRQSPDYAVASFARQIAAIELGRQEPLLDTGNLESQRDFTDVRDLVRAYVLLMERGQTGEVYNAGTGVAYRMREVLEKLLRQAECKIEVRQDLARMRAAEPSVICCNSKRLQSLGWQPRVSLDQTLADTLRHWRQTFSQD